MKILVLSCAEDGFRALLPYNVDKTLLAGPLRLRHHEWGLNSAYTCGRDY
jgi:hypothetical protein